MIDNDSYIYKQGMAPNTRVAISMKNKIYSFMAGQGKMGKIGVVSTFDLSESRNLELIRGVGMGDQISEISPGVTDAMAITLNRTMMYLANVYQALGYNSGIDGLVRSLKHHQWPFDIKQELVFSDLAFGNSANAQGLDTANQLRTPSDASGSAALLTIYEACWIESYSSSYPAESAAVVENLSIKASDVVDGKSTYAATINTGNNPFLYGAGVGASQRFQPKV